MILSKLWRSKTRFVFINLLFIFGSLMSQNDISITTDAKSKIDLQEFIANHVNYPEKAYEKNITGISVIGFIVNAAGNVSNVRIVKSSGNIDLDNEAIRVIKLLPDFTPALSNGTPVSYAMQIPIAFTIEHDNKSEKSKTD